MPETSTGTALPDPVNLWLLPLGNDQPCGPLEYDDESLALRAAAGKPDSQFGPGEPPDRGRIREIAESLSARTRDLRVAMWSSRAKLNLDRFAAFGAWAGEAYGVAAKPSEDDEPDADAEPTSNSTGPAELLGAGSGKTR